MFFSLSKILGFFVVPSNAVAMLCALGAVLLATRFRKAGSRILALGVVLLLVCGYSSLGNLLLLPLTERFPAGSAGGGRRTGSLFSVAPSIPSAVRRADRWRWTLRPSGS